MIQAENKGFEGIRVFIDLTGDARELDRENWKKQMNSMKWTR